MTYDKNSYIMGMVTAFCECVAGGCKRLALSPPLTAADYGAVADEARRVIAAHGLICFHERNEDMPPERRFEWILIARRRETIDEYLRLRAAGLSPADSLAPFYALLSYDEKESVHTGYDAYREAFGPEK
ncbi:MAG: hypothetical protein IKO07_08955 [Clostridia bacterium]|nr:hypothetical protein [Clostridia bacterium]